MGKIRNLQERQILRGRQKEPAPSFSEYIQQFLHVRITQQRLPLSELFALGPFTKYTIKFAGV